MVPAIKRIVRGLDLRACRALAAQALELPDARAVRALVANWTDAQADAETGLENAR
jgi:phosphoenolpyruvate-protein kinase (PTS system EI component)